MTHCPLYIDVAVALPVFKTYTYQVPEYSSIDALIGKRVLVPFNNRRVTGYVIGQSQADSTYKIKPIFDVLDDFELFSPSMVPFFKWISDYYIYPIGEVIQSALPRGINLYDTTEISISEKGEKALTGNRLTPSEKLLLQHLDPSCLLKALQKKLKKNISKSLLLKMEKNGLIVTRRTLVGKKTRQKTDRYVSLIRPDIPVDRFYEHRKKIIDILIAEGDMPLKALKQREPDASGFIEYLKKKEHISVFDKKVYRDPFGDPIQPDTPPLLSKEQKSVVSTVSDSVGKGFSAYLLAGVTGSGKTEVYMHLAKVAMDKGYNVIVLVPEIALITQTERRFRARFGNCVALLHSGLSDGERYDQWLRIIKNEATIVIGARSAIFAPVKNTGLIIVDEEHDSSYKQESSLRYNARDLSVVRAKLQKGVVLLGSATPSMQSSYNAFADKFIPLSLKNRINKFPLPAITIADLRKQRDERGLRRFITPLLINEMDNTLKRGEQILLFLNRRGFANFPVCAACGDVMRCKNCDISLTLHKVTNAYKCHFCGYTCAANSTCPTCDSSSLKLMGFGTQKIETAVQALFPDARIGRLDRDTTTRKGSIVKILKRLKNNEIDILVGTQMIAKGHDFPNITLVGIICADLSLNFPDFRSSERTFQLLAQVAGRAGRGDVPGKVILQTYHPDHFSIKAAQNQDFLEFYNKEIKHRKALNYPPFSRMVQLKISGKDKKITRNRAQTIGTMCRSLTEQNPEYMKTIEILGPVEAPLTKIANHYRWQILLKGLISTRLREFVHQLMLNGSKAMTSSNVKIVVDVDPFSMM